MLLSEHADGRIISKVIGYRHLHSIYGSKTRNGAKAAIQCVKVLRMAHCVGITPDGPKGPYQSISDGVLQIARLANVPIVPITYSIRRHRILNTWDKFMLPLPFSTGTFIVGNPLMVPSKQNEESYNQFKDLLKNEMIVLQDEADKIVCKI